MREIRMQLPTEYAQATDSSISKAGSPYIYFINIAIASIAALFVAYQLCVGFIGISASSFWTDELWTAYFVNAPSMGEAHITHAYRRASATILYYPAHMGHNSGI